MRGQRMAKGKGKRGLDDHDEPMGGPMPPKKMPPKKMPMPPPMPPPMMPGGMVPELPFRAPGKPGKGKPVKARGGGKVPHSGRAAY